MTILIYGKGATACLAMDVLTGYHRFWCVDDDDIVSRINDFPVASTSVLVCLGYQHGSMNSKREEVYERMKICGFKMHTVEPHGLGAGEGCLLMPGSNYHPGVRVGVNCFVSSGVNVGHDAFISDHVWINAGVSIDGGTKIGRRCVIGSNAVIGAGVVLGERTLVGPGAIVLRDTEPGSVWLAPAAEKHRFGSDVFGVLSK